MSKTDGVFRIGNDPVLRIAGNDPVINLSLATNYGKPDQDGKRATQWYDAALWGKRAEALAPYLKKGDRIYVVMNEVHIETYQKNGQDVPKLVAKITDVELIGSGDRQQNGTSTERADYAAAKSGSTTRAPVNSVNDLDSDLPF